MFKINDKVQMTCDGAPAWKTGDVGRIVHIDNDLILYLICFDSNCTEKHTDGWGHAWWAEEDDFELYQRHNKLINCE